MIDNNTHISGNITLRAKIGLITDTNISGNVIIESDNVLNIYNSRITGKVKIYAKEYLTVGLSTLAGNAYINSFGELYIRNSVVDNYPIITVHDLICLEDCVVKDTAKIIGSIIEISDVNICGTTAIDIPRIEITDSSSEEENADGSVNVIRKHFSNMDISTTDEGYILIKPNKLKNENDEKFSETEITIRVPSAIYNN